MLEDRKIVVYLLAPLDRDKLQLQWTCPDTGRRKSRSAGTADPDIAEQKRSDLEYELNHGIAHESSKMPWETFRQIYEEEHLAARREATRKKAGYVFDLFEKLSSPRKLGDINERKLSRHQTAMRTASRKAATIAGHMAYLRAALRWAADQKLIPTAPKIAMPKVPKKTVIRKIVAEQFERIIAIAPSPLWAAFIATAWYTGMRRNEMLDLAWGCDLEKPWVDFDQARVWIPAAYNKSDADQWVPLHPQLAEILAALRKPAGRMFPLRESAQEVSRQFGKLAKRAGLKVTLHDLRRSFGSRYAAVVPAPVLQRLMRHADIKTTLEFYTNVDDKLAEAILKA
jgi:integrase